jgi:hypothetical protein
MGGPKVDGGEKPIPEVIERRRRIEEDWFPWGKFPLYSSPPLS